MKKTLCILVVLMMVFAMAACTPQNTEDMNESSDPTEVSAGNDTIKESDTTESDSTEPDNSGDEQLKIAVVVGETSNPWYVRTAEGVAQYAEDSGNLAFQKGPDKADAAAQVQVVEDVIAQGIDALCIIPITPEALEPVLKKARDKGIIVIAQEGAVLENIDYDLEGFVPKEYGSFIMDNLAELMGEEGQYVTMVSYLTASSHNEWADAGIVRAEEMYPNMELIAEQKLESEDNQEKAYEKAKEILKKYPDLKGFMGTSSNDAPGIAKAINELGLTGKVFVCGSCVTSLAEKFFEDGSLARATLWDPALSTYAQCVLAEKMIKGEEVKDGINLVAEGYQDMKLDSTGKVIMGDGMIVLTKENMYDYNF